MSGTCRVDPARPSLIVRLQNRTTTWHFDKYPRRELALEVMRVIKSMVEHGGYFNTFASYKAYRYSLGSNLNNINRHDPAGRVYSLRDMDRAFLDGIDHPGMKTSAWSRFHNLIFVLRAARTFNPEATAPDLNDPVYGDRLSFISRYERATPLPRDSYSPHVAAQIQTAARSDIAAVSERVRAGIQDLRALQARAARPSERLSPSERSMLHLARTGSVDFEAFKRDIQQAGLFRFGAAHTRQVSDFPKEDILRAAEFLALGLEQREVSRRLGWPEMTVTLLISNDQTFISIVEAAEDRALERTQDEIVKFREARQHRLDTYARTAAAAGRTRGDLTERKDHPSILKWYNEQIDRRLSVLRAWVEAGVPREKLGTVNFTMQSMERWDDPELGIAPIGRLNSSKPMMRQIVDRRSEFTNLLQALNGGLKRCFFNGYIQRLLAKIEVLEEWVLNGMPEEQVPGFIFTLRHFIAWEDDALGITRLSPVDTTTTHPRYGRFVQHTYTLLQSLRIQCRQRGLLPGRTISGPRTFEAEVRAPGIFGPNLCPTQDELTSFIAHLGLMCQIDYGSLKELQRDCLRNAANGRVDIVYLKARPHSTEKVQSERDGSLETPGGLIRRVLELTQVAHEAMKQAGHPDADNLWLGYFTDGEFRKCRFAGHLQKCWRRFCERHGIIGDDGDQLDTILPSRFRKTVKATKYRKRNGDLYAITDDHTPAVARDHYANLPSLEEAHDAAVDRGLRRALDEVTARVVSNDNTPEAAKRLSEATGEPVEICAAVLAGDEDTWLAGCMSFYKSPFGSVGEPCPTPFTECLHCSNSVFVARKLPNLLRYRRWLLLRRGIVSDAEWHSLYAQDLARIDVQIVPQFTAAQLAEAELLIVDDEDQDPLFIPAAIREAI
ncbi:hypothetical protein [Microvirga calopogonii]|uniref:hypothetical protein n=1 Tax=Microvirga calopogonii TaxID=2078013 RepID=UPI0013B3BF46|nr:hypothetical protein [Microvirga calopogonii]